jgi:hypothetical protein
MSDVVDTHGYCLTFGKHEGKLITRVDLGYLRWMINNHTPDSEYAEAELERRGSAIPTLSVSGHAIDRASLRVLDIWLSKRKNAKEGLYSWLSRVAAVALRRGTLIDGKVRHKGIVFIFDTETEWPVLKTIMLKDRGNGK